MKEYDLAYEAASRAVALEPNNTLALKALSSVNHYLGRFAESEAHAQRSVVEGGSFGQALIAIANTKLGLREEARTALIELEKFELMADDPEGYLRRSGATDENVDAMVTGLEEARQYTNL